MNLIILTASKIKK